MSSTCNLINKVPSKVPVSELILLCSYSTHCVIYLSFIILKSLSSCDLRDVVSCIDEIYCIHFDLVSCNVMFI